MQEGRARGSVPDRRLHRLLHLASTTRRTSGKLFPPRQPAAAELPSGCRSATTGAPPSVVSRARRSSRRTARRCRPARARPRSALASAWTTKLELGFVVGPGNALGTTDPDRTQGDQRRSASSLLNDWSARDIQAWEYQPLGPFLAKNFATTRIAVDRDDEALAPVSRAGVRRAPKAIRQPLPYLADADRRAGGHLDIRVEMICSRKDAPREGRRAYRVSAASYATCYWTPGADRRAPRLPAATSRPATFSAAGRSPARTEARRAR